MCFYSCMYVLDLTITSTTSPNSLLPTEQRASSISDQAHEKRYLRFTFHLPLSFCTAFVCCVLTSSMTQPFRLASLIEAFALNLNDSMFHQICNPQRQEQDISVTMTTRLLGDSGAVCEVCCHRLLLSLCCRAGFMFVTAVS